MIRSSRGGLEKVTGENEDALGREGGQAPPTPRPSLRDSVSPPTKSSLARRTSDAVNLAAMPRSVDRSRRTLPRIEARTHAPPAQESWCCVLHGSSH